MLWIFHFVAWVTIGVGFAFILSKTLPRNKVGHFLVLFVMCVPFNVIVNYVDAWALGFSKMGWIANFILSFLVAILGTFWPPERQNANGSDIP